MALFWGFPKLSKWVGGLWPNSVGSSEHFRLINGRWEESWGACYIQSFLFWLWGIHAHWRWASGLIQHSCPWALWCFILHSCTERNAIKLYQIKVPYKVTHTNNVRKILIKLKITCHSSTCLKLLPHFNLKRMNRYCNLCRQILHLYKSDQVCTGDKKSHTMSLAWPSILLNYKLYSCGLTVALADAITNTKWRLQNIPSGPPLQKGCRPWALSPSEAQMQSSKKPMRESNTFENNVFFSSDKLLPFPSLSAGKSNSTNSVYLLKRQLLSHLSSAGHSHATDLPSVHLLETQFCLCPDSPLRTEKYLMSMLLKTSSLSTQIHCLYGLYVLHTCDFQLFSSQESHSPKEVPSPMWLDQSDLRPLGNNSYMPWDHWVSCRGTACYLHTHLACDNPDKITATNQDCFLRLWPFSLHLFSQVPSFMPCLWKSSTPAVVLTGRQG